MSDQHDGGPAFPRPSSEAHDAQGRTFYPCAYDGMTLRDYFAGQALVGLLASNMGRVDDGSSYADLALLHADAMLEARKQPDQTEATE